MLSSRAPRPRQTVEDMRRENRQRQTRLERERRQQFLTTAAELRQESAEMPTPTTREQLIEAGLIRVSA